MKLETLEEELSNVKDLVHRSVLELIISAVKDYPVKDLADTKEYFSEVRKLIDTSEITEDALNVFLNKSSWSENTWVNTSLTSLCEAYQLLRIHKLHLSDVLEPTD